MSRSSTMAVASQVVRQRASQKKRGKLTYQANIPAALHNVRALTLIINLLFILNKVNLWEIWRVIFYNLSGQINMKFQISTSASTAGWDNHWKEFRPLSLPPPPLSSSHLLHSLLVPNPRLLFCHSFTRQPLFSPPCHPLLPFAFYRAPLKAIICLPVPEHWLGPWGTHR